jgi:hypothetical protein
MFIATFDFRTNLCSMCDICTPKGGDMGKASLLSAKDFGTKKAALAAGLKAALQAELADASWATGAASDLWDLPPVDSKTVCKLSPVVKSAIGHSIDPKWIRKGGYASVDAAISHVLSQIEEHCVLSLASAHTAIRHQSTQKKRAHG